MRYSKEQIRAMLNDLETRRARELENETLEFKEWIADRNRLYKTLIEYAVCFANHEGGTIVLGVKDGVIGLQKALTGCGAYDSYEIKRRIYESTDPKILVDIEELFIDEFGVKILLVHVPRGIYVHTTTDGTAKIRIGSDCRPLTGTMRHQRLVGIGLLDFTESTIDKLSIRDLDKNTINRLRSLINQINPHSQLLSISQSQMLEQLGITRDGIPTFAGLLVAGKQELINQYIPCHEIQYLRMKSSTEYDMRRDYKSNLIDSLEEIYSLIESTNQVTSIQIGLQRLEIKDYPVESYREAILNAVMHRDYTTHGAVVIRQYPDRLEISNPGGFVYGITLDNLLWQDSRPRNPRLAEILRKIGYVERAGMGIKRIFYNQIISGKLIPTYSLEENRVLIILYSKPIDDKFIKMINYYLQRDINLDLEHLIILSTLRQQKEISSRDASTVLQMDIARARNILNEMERNRILQKSGQARAQTFHFSESACRLLGIETPRRHFLSEPSQQERIILMHVREHGSIDNKTVREILQLDQYRASRFLRRLMEEGKLKRVGSTKSARYVFP